MVIYRRANVKLFPRTPPTKNIKWPKNTQKIPLPDQHHNTGPFLRPKMSRACAKVLFFLSSGSPGPERSIKSVAPEHVRLRVTLRDRPALTVVTIKRWHACNSTPHIPFFKWHSTGSGSLTLALSDFSTLPFMPIGRAHCDDSKSQLLSLLVQASKTKRKESSPSP